jgi:hypothetical protein
MPKRCPERAPEPLRASPAQTPVPMRAPRHLLEERPTVERSTANTRHTEQ